MNLRPTIVTALCALILISLSAALPISSSIVEEQTSIGLFRKGVDSILPAEQPAKLRVLVEGPQHLKEPMRVWVKRQASIEIVDDPQAPLMVLSVGIDGSRMVAKGTLSEKNFEQSARLGDWTALVPPLVAVVLAIGLRQVVLALFLAVWLVVDAISYRR